MRFPVPKCVQCFLQVRWEQLQLLHEHCLLCPSSDTNDGSAGRHLFPPINVTGMDECAAAINGVGFRNVNAEETSFIQ
jgi:hypothetical protein